MQQVVALLLLFGLWTGCASGAEKWTRLTTPHFELYTTAGEKKGRETILYFEQVRSFFAKVLISKKVTEIPVRLVVFRSEAQFRPYAPNSVAAAYYAPGRYRDSIVLQNADPEHLHLAIHEYMHLVVEHTSLNVPLWLNEGLADVFSTLRPMGKKAMIGDLIPSYLQSLKTEKWMSFEALTSVDHKSEEYNEKKRVGILYAESWALTHMLYLSPEYLSNFSQFLTAISSGKSPAEACQIAYGRPAAQVYADLRTYLTRNRLFGATFNVNLAKSEEEAELSTVAPVDSEIVLADLLTVTGKQDQAGEAYRKLAAENPRDSDISRSMGYLAWQNQDHEGARQQFEKSFADGGRDSEMCFDMAMLELEKDQASEKAVAALERALEVKPDYAEARLQLGLVQMNAHRYGAALAELSQIHRIGDEHAAALFNALAYSYGRLGALDEARKKAATALNWARTDADKQRTEEILRFLNASSERGKPALADSGLRPDGNRPILTQRDEPEPSSAPNPPNSNLGARQVEKIERVEGTAKNVDCNGKRFLVDVGGRILAFDMPEPDKILLRHNGSAAFDFTCGPQKPFHVVVEFSPPGKNHPDVRGTLRTLEF